jgi:hypothetical protein
MSLITFHRFLISAGIAFCLGFAGWEAAAFTRTREGGALALAVVFFVLGLALAYYLSRLAFFLTGRSGR